MQMCTTTERRIGPLETRQPLNVVVDGEPVAPLPRRADFMTVSATGALPRVNSVPEPVAEAVTDKQRANFCDYFEPSSETYEAQADADALKAEADKLFDL